MTVPNIQVSTEGPDILDPAFEADPYAAYEIMREQYPLYWHPGTQSYVISRYEDVEKSFKDPVFTSDNYSWQLEPVHGRTILQMEGREHSTHRALVTPAFRGRDLAGKFLPVIDRNARELVEAFAGESRIDLVDRFATRLPINVIVEMLDLPKSDHEQFRQWYIAIIAFLSNLSGNPEVQAKGMQTKAEFEQYMLPLIAERRAHPGDDLLTTLCTAEIDGVHMSDEEIKSFCSLLLTAGGETTDKAFGSLFMNLVANPDQLAAVRANRDLIDVAFAETLRLTPPVHMIMREAKEDVQMSGGVIEKGRTITCLIGAANRDPRKYINPDVFDIHREDLNATRAFSAAANHTAFALGRHFCVGAMLSKTEVRMGTDMLLDAMEDITFSPGTEPRETGVFLRAPEELWLDFRSVPLGDAERVA